MLNSRLFARADTRVWAWVADVEISSCVVVGLLEGEAGAFCWVKVRVWSWVRISRSGVDRRSGFRGERFPFEVLALRSAFSGVGGMCAVERRVSHWARSCFSLFVLLLA